MHPQPITDLSLPGRRQLVHALPVRSIVTVRHPEHPERCSATVASCTTYEVTLTAGRGQRFPHYVRPGATFVVTTNRTPAQSFVVRACTAGGTFATIEVVGRSSSDLDNRRHSRVPVLQPTRIEVAGPQGSTAMVGVLRDVSVGGCAIALADAVEVGSAVRVVVRLGHVPIDVRGLVVRCKPIDEGTWTIGLAFDGVADAHHRAIADFVRTGRARNS
jgi:hypothetical protein